MVNAAKAPTVRYVALGDSFTEGVGDDGSDGMIGWADRVARSLASHEGRPVGYANLAIRGRTLDAIITEQVNQALSLRPLPTLVTLCGGGNDMLRPGFTVQKLQWMMRGAIARLLAVDATVVIVTPADPSAQLPFGRMIHSRGSQLADANEVIARDMGVLIANVSRDDPIRSGAYWSDDRLHLNRLGYERVAGLVTSTLTGSDIVPDLVPARARNTALDHAVFARTHLVPWVHRRLRGRSSGDGRSARYPDWVEFAPS